MTSKEASQAQDGAAPRSAALAAEPTQLQTFDDPTVTDTDRFGFSVALSGDRVLIGAPFDNTQGSSNGQAHLFDATTGAPLQTFDNPTVTGSDLFGDAVATGGVVTVSEDQLA